MPDLATLAALFCARLRTAGLPVGPERTARFAAGLTAIRPHSTVELYRCALVTLVADPAHRSTFDTVFAAVFGAGRDRADLHAGPPNGSPPTLTPAERRAQVDLAELLAAPTNDPSDSDDSDDTNGDDPTEELTYGVLADPVERLGTRDFASLSTQELAELITVMRRLRLVLPRRRSRRFEPAARGRRIDLRGTLRQAQRTGGYPVRLARHRPKVRPRRLVVLCDISGSMEPYARALLQLLYCVQASGPRVEVFTFATTLTRLTRTLAQVRPDAALALAGHAAPDWAGGTRIGAALKVFLDRYGQRGMARGAVILIISDGWEIGDAALLGRQMKRLSLLAHRIVWANPRTASPRYEPLVAGMAAAWPHCDAVVSAHSLRALDDLLAALAA